MRVEARVTETDRAALPHIFTNVLRSEPRSGRKKRPRAFVRREHVDAMLAGALTKWRMRDVTTFPSLRYDGGTNDAEKCA